MIKDRISISDSYEFYKNRFDNTLPKNVYLSLNYLYMQFLMDKVFLGKEVTLPASCGTLQVTGKRENVVLEDGKVKGLSPNWPKTKELWQKDEVAKKEKKIIYNLNHQTNGVRYKFFWNRNNMKVTNMRIYFLKMSRANKRLLHKKIMAGSQQYIVR